MTVLITDKQRTYIENIIVILQLNEKTKSRMYEVLVKVIVDGCYYKNDIRWFNTTVRDYYLRNK